MSKPSDVGTRLEIMRRRLRGTVEGHGGAKAIAKLSGLPVNTLSNYIRGVVKEPPASNLIQIAEACGVSPAWLMALDEDEDVDRLSEDDVTLGSEPTSPSSDARRGDTVWKVESRVLELYGILPGDLIEFDTSAKPRRGDVVLAKQIGLDLDRERKLIRVFNPPFLVSKTMDASLDEQPIPIDPKDERVKIVGAFVRLTRGRRT